MRNLLRGMLSVAPFLRLCALRMGVFVQCELSRSVQTPYRLNIFGGGGGDRRSPAANVSVRPPFF